MITSSIGTDYPQTGIGDGQNSKTAQDLGRDAFLKLLVAQLQHQDPLNPLDGQEFAAQLAQFSSLEQLFGVNEALAGIQKSLATNQNENILDYIGKTVKTRDNTVSIKGEAVDSGAYILENGADVNITISNAQGATVCSIDAGWQPAGEHSLDWDGRDDQGRKLSDGSYTFRIQAVDLNGSAVAADTYHTGEVSGVVYDQTIPYLMVGEKMVTPDQVVEVKKQNSY